MENKISTPIAIIFAGILIAGAVLYGTKDGSSTTSDSDTAAPKRDTGSLEEMRPVSESDHIRGNLNAKVFVVEYSDTECPYCKQFHTTMKQVMDEYGNRGEVAWVYRHFPLDQLHSKARNEALALECAAELGGNDKFWAYTDRIYEITPTNNGLDPAELPKIAQYVGLNINEFNTCMASNKYAKKVESDAQNGIATGARGTPWNIVVTQDGDKRSLPGAYPYTAVKQLIDEVLASE